MKDFYTKYLVLIFTSLLAVDSLAQDLSRNSNYWTTNGEVRDMHVDTTNGKIYLGGEFSRVGPRSNGFALANLSDGSPIEHSVLLNDVATAVISDGEGGWFVGGAFTEVNGEPRTSLARISADGELMDWNVELELQHPIQEMVLHEGILYISAYRGSWEVSGDPLYQVNVETQEASFFDLGIDYPNSEVEKIAFVDDEIFVGGRIPYYGSVGRDHLWLNTEGQPFLEEGTKYFDAVIDVAYDGNGAWYAFGQIGSFWPWEYAIKRITEEGIDEDFHVSIGNTSIIKGLTFFEGNLFFFSDTTTVNGETRAGISVVDAENGDLIPWNTNIRRPLSSTGSFVDEFNAMVAYDEHLYISGDFGKIGNITRAWGLLDTINGQTSNDVSLDANNQVNVIASDEEGGYLLGGQFTKVGGQGRLYFAHIHEDGSLSSLSIQFEGGEAAGIQDIFVHEGIAYIGGEFSSINGTPKEAFAAIDLASHEVLPLNLDIKFYGTGAPIVRSIEIHGGEVFITGRFSEVLGKVRGHIASFDLNTGELSSFNGKMEGSLGGNTLVINESKIYAGGNFRSAGEIFGTTPLDASSGRPLFYDDLNLERVSAAVSDGNNGYFIFGRYKGGTSSLGRINSIGEYTELPLDLIGTPRTMAIYDNALLVGGSLSSINGENCGDLIAIDIPSYTYLPDYNFDVNGTVNKIVVDGDVVYACGGFLIESNEQKNLASWNILADSVTLRPWNPVAPDALTASQFFMDLEVWEDLVFTVGGFTSQFEIFDGPNEYLVAIDKITGDLSDWAPDINNQIDEIEVHNNQVYIAGRFTEIDGTEKSKIASFDANTLSFSDFEVDMEGDIRALTILGDTLYMGGVFSSINNETRWNLAGIDLTTQNLTGWGDQLTDEPQSIPAFNQLIHNGSSVMFTATNSATLGGRYTKYLASFDRDTYEVTEERFDFGGDVKDMDQDENYLYVGGSFGNYGGNFIGPAVRIEKTTSEVDLDFFYDLEASGICNAVEVSEIGIFLGGSPVSESSSTIQARIRLHDLQSGEIIDWNGASDSDIKNISYIDGLVGVAPVFTPNTSFTVGGSPAEDVLRIDINSGEIENIPTSEVNSFRVADLVVHNDLLYMGGGFSEYSDGGTSYEDRGLVAYDLNINEFIEFTPTDAPQDVRFLRKYEDELYYSGFIQSLGRFNTNSQSFTNMTSSIQPEGWVQALDVSNDRIVLAVSSQNDEHNGERLMVVDFDGEIVDFEFSTGINTYVINQLVADEEGRFFVGGDFSQVNGNEAWGIMRYSQDLEEIWVPEISAPNTARQISDFEIADNRLFIVGPFDSIADLSRRQFASFDLDNLELTDWDPANGGSNIFLVDEIEIMGELALIPIPFSGGNDFIIGGVPRNRLAAIDINTGLANDWDLEMDRYIEGLEVHGDKIVAFGDFTTVNGVERSSIAAFSADDFELDLNWENYTQRDIFSVNIKDNVLALAGNFTSSGMQPRQHIAELDLNTGALTDWSPVLEDVVNSVMRSGDKVYAGLFEAPIPLFAIPVENDSVLEEPIAFAPGQRTVYELEVRDSLLAVAGTFGSINGNDVNGYGLVNLNTNEVLGPLYSGIATKRMRFYDDYLFFAGVKTTTTTDIDQDAPLMWALDLTTMEEIDWNIDYEIFGTHSLQSIFNGRWMLDIDDSFIRFGSNRVQSINNIEVNTLVIFDRADMSLVDWSADLDDAITSDFKEMDGDYFISSGIFGNGSISVHNSEGGEPILRNLFGDMRQLFTYDHKVFMLGEVDYDDFGFIFDEIVFHVYDYQSCNIEVACQEELAFEIPEFGFFELDPSELVGLDYTCTAWTLNLDNNGFNCDDLGENLLEYEIIRPGYDTLFCTTNLTLSASIEIDEDQDNVCDSQEISGCQDPFATNYNPLATDPGLCFYDLTNFEIVPDDPLLEPGEFFLRPSSIDSIPPSPYSSKDLINQFVSQLVLYPNPANDEIFLAFNAPKAEEAVLKVTNLLGQTLMQENVQIKSGRNNIRISLENLQEGQYLLVANSRYVNVAEKFVIKR